MPTPRLSANVHGMATERFDIDDGHGGRLAGRLELPDGPPRATAIFVHCFACGKGSLGTVHMSRALAQAGVAVLRFDLAGEGEGGRLEPFERNIADIVAAGQALTAAGRSPSLLVGHSLGGTAAIAAAASLPQVERVAVIGSPFSPAHIGALFSPYEVGGEAQIDVGSGPIAVSAEFRAGMEMHDAGAALASLGRPLLILHAPNDPVVPIAQGEQMFAIAAQPKSFVALPGVDHLVTRTADAEHIAGLIADWGLPKRRPSPRASRPAVLAHETRLQGLQIAIQAGPTELLADEPLDKGGADTGPSPHELVAAGLAACTAITLRLYADRKGWPLQRTYVRVEESKPDPAGPHVFAITLRFEGALDAAQHAKLVAIAERCSVHRTLAEGATITTDLATGL